MQGHAGLFRCMLVSPIPSSGSGAAMQTRPVPHVHSSFSFQQDDWNCDSHWRVSALCRFRDNGFEVWGNSARPANYAEGLPQPSL